MKLVIFSGTIDGNNLCKWLCEQNFEADVYVATQYGKDVMQEMKGINIHVGRLDKTQIENILSHNTYVIDATHPYATEVTQNIKNACEAKKAKYIRFLRESIKQDEDVICVESTEHAVKFLSQTKGNVLLTTGSKELEAYTKIPNYKNRLFIRVLPSVDVIQKCFDLGFLGTNIIAMQGPFSLEMNIALLKQKNCDFMVTKDTGNAGGFYEKQVAAQKANVKMIVINRPTDEIGYNFEQIKEIIINIYKNSYEYHKFPLFISLKDKNCLVVGAGNIAQRRINILKQFGANVKIVSKCNKYNISDVCIKSYDENDLKDMFLVVAATNEREINHKIYIDCKKNNIFVSVADCANESSFFFPAICKNDDFVCGLVSNGKHHTKVSKKAKQIRNILENKE